MEAQFGATEGRFTTTLTYYWIALTTVFLMVSLPVRCVKFGWFAHPDLVFSLHFLPFAILALLLVAMHAPRLKAHIYHLLCGANLAMIGWIACSVHLLAVEDLAAAEASALAEVFLALQQNAGAAATLRRYLGDELGQKFLWYALVVNFFHLDLLQFLGMTWVSLSVLVSVPLSLWIVSSVSPLVTGSSLEVLVVSVILVLYTMGLGYYMSLGRRQQFKLDYQLQRTLENEAAAFKKAAQQEAALKEAAQDADTILNHLLKNVMADAAGCIHLYLHSLSPNPLTAPPPDLVQATECLERGVAWCRKRQALLRIASGKYVPQLCDVDLAHFGRRLLQGRPFEAEFPENVVQLDPLLCEIV
eukprot:EG_transcript_16575